MLSFQKYWWLKNPAIWVDKKLLACNLTSSIFQIWSLNRKIKNWKIFQFSISPTKNNNKFSRKLKKSLFWTRFEQFLLILGQTRNILENLHLPFFCFLIFIVVQNFRKNLSASSKRNWLQTNGRTDGQVWIHRTSTPPGVQTRSTAQLPYIWITENS